MKTTNHHGRKVVGLISIGPHASNGKQTEAGRRQSHNGLEQRVTLLEQQVAGLAAKNAGLVRVNKSLADARRQLRALIDNLPDCVYIKDTAGRKTLANPADLKNLRCQTEAEAIGKSDLDFFPKDIAEKFWADDQKVIAGQPVINREEYLFDEAGRKRWLLTSKLPLHDQDGKIVGLIGIGRDITQQKQAEEALRRSNETLAQERLLLRTLIDNLPDGIYAKDTAGRKTLANPADLKNLRCQTEAEAIGKSDFDFFPKDIAEKFWADDQKVIQGQPVIKREEFFIDEKGRKRWLLTSKLPLRDQAGKIVGLVGIGRDITQQKQAEEALRRSDEKLRQFAAQLERSNRELQDFAYVASHDLQEPLRKIVVFGERLKEKNAEKFGPESLDYLDRMQKATARMQTLINDLLTFSRVTTKAQPFTPVNLAEVAAAVVDDLEGRIELVKGRVEVGTLPVIDAEPLQMRQLLQNLIGNALKFRRPEEPPVVKVEAQIIPDPDTPEKKLCRLTVSDNCIGFDEKYLDRIFNVFQRLHTRNEYEGTGMGLAIVQKIALHHGGDVTAKSKPGEGSTFIVTVPVVQPQKAPDENQKQGKPNAVNGRSPTRWSGGIHCPRRVIKMRLGTKPYLVPDGDLINFRVNKRAWRPQGKAPWPAVSRSAARNRRQSPTPSGERWKSLTTRKQSDQDQNINFAASLRCCSNRNPRFPAFVAAPRRLDSGAWRFAGNGF